MKKPKAFLFEQKGVMMVEISKITLINQSIDYHGYMVKFKSPSSVVIHLVLIK